MDRVSHVALAFGERAGKKRCQTASTSFYGAFPLQGGGADGSQEEMTNDSAFPPIGLLASRYSKIS